MRGLYAPARVPGFARRNGPWGGTPFEARDAVDPRRVREAGFALLELIIVGALVAILAAIAVPTISAARDGYELVTAGANVAAKVAEARTNALKRNRQTWILVDPGAGTLQIQMAGAVGAVDIGTLERLPARVAIDVPAAATALNLDTIGRPVDGAGVLTPHVIQVRHTGNGQIRTVTVGTTGRLTIN
jgi:type II secretory pathway pseudopilin PulG